MCSSGQSRDIEGIRSGRRDYNEVRQRKSSRGEVRCEVRWLQVDRGGRVLGAVKNASSKLFILTAC